MPKIEISDATFARLQGLAVPLVDSNDSVIAKLLDDRENGRLSHPNGAQKPARSAIEPREFTAASPPGLTHAKMLSGSVNGNPIKDVTWNGFLVETIRQAKTAARDESELRRVVPVNFNVQGKKETEGYHFYPDIDLSIQGKDAKTAWLGAYSIAQQLGFRIEVEFQWRRKDGAAFPGVIGKLSA
jgi:hypothetical protein